MVSWNGSLSQSLEFKVPKQNIFPWITKTKVW
jgi:hypothetical protein